jgi:hypothetical protein
MTITTYTDLVNDNFSADTFRAYMAHQYGQDLEFGMSVSKFGRAIDDAKHLGKILGLGTGDKAIDQIFETAREDRELIDLGA